MTGYILMNVFGIASQAALGTADSNLIIIANRVLSIKDHSILKGHRPHGEQDAAYYGNPQRSKLKWPDGKHNALPSRAIDVQTYPLPQMWEKESRKYNQSLREEQLYLLGLYVGVASEMGTMLRTGADWDRDGEIADNGWDDLFHVELV